MSKSSGTSSDQAQAQPAKSYRVTRPEGYEGVFRITYPDPSGDGEKYAADGDVVSDLPHGSIHWLLMDGYIELAHDDKPAPEAKAGDK